jgi:hypothetical protein
MSLTMDNQLPNTFIPLGLRNCRVARQIDFSMEYLSAKLLFNRNGDYSGRS